jgi:cob(I)alamin adenosyltransferase
MIILFTGNGKGKTTASLGQMIRAIGRGKKALMIQFIKGPWKSGEDEFAESFQIPNSKFQIRKMGLGFVGILGDQLPIEEHQKAAVKALIFFKDELAKNIWDLIVLDEINVAASLNLVMVPDVINELKKVPDETLVILTGRGAPKEFIDTVDLATEMKEIKHPFNDGRIAKLGIEF